jgi:hypothetical protein
MIFGQKCFSERLKNDEILFENNSPGISGEPYFNDENYKNNFLEDF